LMEYPFLNLVEAPGRYIGKEINSCTKDWASAKVKICFAFPETYELGMSNLGWRLLYEIVNSQRTYLGERVFAPSPSLEQILREKGIPLSSLESNTPLSKFDVIGVTLASELSYSNLLTILSLGGITLQSEERGEDEPLVIAGGNGAFAPEPMAPFCDAFFVGEGEEVILAILKTIQETAKEPRRERLRALSRLPGVYVPLFYQPQYNEDNVYLGLVPKEKSFPEQIKRVIITDFENAPFCENWVVPYLQIVHDRIGVEIMRGCMNRCRFCQARVIYGPCRIRSPEKIYQLVITAFKKTGYEEVSLLSLSSGDYPYLPQLKELLSPFCRKKNLKISFPSLRFDTFSLTETNLEKGKKPVALTFAPESSERMRTWLNKNLKDAELWEQIRVARAKGWRHIKLYFMLGLPGENDQDIREVANLIMEMSKVINLNLSFNTFIPKPHTPLERCGMAKEEEIDQKIRFLKERFRRNRSLSYSFHLYKQSLLEAVLARGDRTVGQAIVKAWKKGARFDGRKEFFRFDLWQEAMAEMGVNYEMFLKEQPEGAVLPWSHIVI